MAGFGGAVKLTGESSYRKALAQITQSLKEVSSEMGIVTSQYDKNDKSTEAVAAQTEVLNKQLDLEKKKLDTLKAQYDDMSRKYQDNAEKHEALVRKYNEEKVQLEYLGKTLGATSEEYKDQRKRVEELANDVRKSTSAQ